MYSDDYTEDLLQDLEKRINALYETANRELQEKLDNYLEGYKDERGIYHKGLKDRYLEQYAAYKAGLYTKEQFDAWWRSQIGRGTRWEAVRDASAALLTNTNQEASGNINDTTRNIYAENYNYNAYQIEGSMNIIGEIDAGVSFNLADPNTIQGLAQSKIDLQRDRKWNEGRLQNAVLQGIIQGESISKIADRLQFSDYSGAIKRSCSSVAYMNRNSAIRNARTFVTCAQNAGRQKSYEDAEEMGIELQKEWMSAHDERTRESHRMLDGVRVAQEKRFPNGLMYPGDSLGAPAERYNCRCTMRAVLPGINDQDREVFVRDDNGNWVVTTAPKTYDDYQDWKLSKTAPTHSANSLKDSESERESEQEKMNRSDYLVTFDLKSEQLLEKIKKLGESEGVTKTIHQQARRMLERKGGTWYEELYYIDSINNKYKSRTDSHILKIKKQVTASEDMINMLSNSPQKTIIGMHNHPGSTTPSLSDLYSCRKYKYGLIICHDGTVFKYTVKEDAKLPSLEKDENNEYISTSARIFDSKLSSVDIFRKMENEIAKKEYTKLINWLYNKGVELEEL